MFNSLQPLHNGIFPTTKTGGNEAGLPTQALSNLLVCSLVFLLQDFISLSHGLQFVCSVAVMGHHCADRGLHGSVAIC